MENNELQKTQGNGSFEVFQNEEGKFVRRAIYQPFSSVDPQTREEKINLLKLLQDEHTAIPVNEAIGGKIKLTDVIFKPYDSIDEETGEVTYGVLTYLLEADGNAYVTSSKSVYHTLKEIFNVFGEPHYNEEEVITLEFVKKSGPNYKYTDVKLIG